MEYQHKLSVEDQEIAKGLLLQNEDNWNYSVEEQKAKTFALKNEDLEISSSKDQISPADYGETWPCKNHELETPLSWQDQISQQIICARIKYQGNLRIEDLKIDENFPLKN